MMDTSEEESVFGEAAKQMGDTIRQLTTNNTGNINKDRIIENMGVFREYMINYEEPKLFNDFIADFKKRLFSGELGEAREMWRDIRRARLGLIDQTSSEHSKITAEEASKVSAVHLVEDDPYHYADERKTVLGEERVHLMACCVSI